MLVEVLPDLERDRWRLEPAHHLRAPQVEHTVAQPQLLRGVDPVLDHERRHLRGGDQLQRLLGQHLDLARRHLGVDVPGRARRRRCRPRGSRPRPRAAQPAHAQRVRAQHLYHPRDSAGPRRRSRPGLGAAAPAWLHRPADVGGPQTPTERTLEDARMLDTSTASRPSGNCTAPAARAFNVVVDLDVECASRTLLLVRCRPRPAARTGASALAALARDPDAARRAARRSS